MKKEIIAARTQPVKNRKSYPKTLQCCDNFILNPFNYFVTWTQAISILQLPSLLVQWDLQQKYSNLIFLEVNCVHFSFYCYFFKKELYFINVFSSQILDCQILDCVVFLLCFATLQENTLIHLDLSSVNGPLHTVWLTGMGIVNMVNIQGKKSSKISQLTQKGLVLAMNRLSLLTSMVQLISQRSLVQMRWTSVFTS